MNIDDVLKYGDLKLLGQVKDLPEEEWYTQGVCGWWSVRDIFSHLISYELMFVDTANSLLDSNQTTDTLDDFIATRGDKFNQEQVAKRQNYKSSEVLAEYTTAHNLLISSVKKIPADTRRKIGLLGWYGDEYDFEDMICYANYGHKREHSAQIAVHLDNLKSK